MLMLTVLGKFSKKVSKAMVQLLIEEVVKILDVVVDELRNSEPREISVSHDSLRHCLAHAGVNFTDQRTRCAREKKLTSNCLGASLAAHRACSR